MKQSIKPAGKPAGKQTITAIQPIKAVKQSRTRVVEIPVEVETKPLAVDKTAQPPSELAPESIQFASLPLVSCMSREDMDEAKRLLEEYDGTDTLLKQLEGEKEKLKKGLAELQKKYALVGMRWGGWAYASRAMEGRESLSKELLIQAGVGADVIKACTIRGKPYERAEFRRVKGEG